MEDQAQELKELMGTAGSSQKMDSAAPIAANAHKTRIIAITSGKGV